MGTGTTGLVIFSDVFGGKVGKCRGKKAGFWTHGYRHFGTFSDIFRYSHMRVIATHAVYPRFIKTPALREKSAVYPRRISRKCRLFTLVLPALSRNHQVRQITAPFVSTSVANVQRSRTRMRCIQRAQGAFKRWKRPRARQVFHRQFTFTKSKTEVPALSDLVKFKKKYKSADSRVPELLDL